jgi:hypothetical protein
VRRSLRHAALGLCLVAGIQGAARGDALGEALDCLGAQEKVEAQRDLSLQRADSLGQKIAAWRAAGKEAPEEWLRSAEKIQRAALENELELLSRRTRCRELAGRALSASREEIGRIEAELHTGAGGSESAQRLLYLESARTRLEGAATGPATLGVSILPPDSSDTQEVLQGKLQYYQDMRGYLAGLGERVSSRLDRLTRDREALAEAQRFLRDLGFLGEGGKALPGGMMQGVGTVPGAGGRPGEVAEGADSTARAPSPHDLEFALGLTPSTPEQTDQLVGLLKGFQKEIRRESGLVDQEIAKCEKRINPADAKP